MSTSMCQSVHPRVAFRHIGSVVVLLGSLLTPVALHAAAATGPCLSDDVYTYCPVDVPLPGQGWTRIVGMTEMGSLVGTHRDLNGTDRSWRYSWKTKTFTAVRAPGQQLILTDLNNTGRVVGNYHTRTEDGTFTVKGGRLRVIPGIGMGCNLNNDGGLACAEVDEDGITVTVLADTSGIRRGTIRIPDAHETIPLGLGDAGDVVGTFTELPTFRWRGWHQHGVGGEREGQIDIIDAPCDGYTFVQDINLADTMAVVCIPPDETLPPESYVYDGETWTPVRVPHSAETTVMRITNRGHLAGWYRNQDFIPHGFIATPLLEEAIAASDVTDDLE